MTFRYNSIILKHTKIKTVKERKQTHTEENILRGNY